VLVPWTSWVHDEHPNTYITINEISIKLTNITINSVYFSFSAFFVLDLGDSLRAAYEKKYLP
jgi:hypothetical protein